MNDQMTQDFVTQLRARGYAVLPTPRQVSLSDGSVCVDGSWGLEAEGVPDDDIAVRTLRDGLRDEHGLVPGEGPGGRCIRLGVRPGAVETGTGDGRDGQAYRLTVTDRGVEVVGNTRCGLFYGVQTLRQLLAGNGRALALPVCEIRDWPRYLLRIFHWDTKHHQDRIETLQRFLDYGAYFKLNAVSFELEDKFEYPSHPEIGAPGAFTTAQLQELTDYGLQRYVQIIPNVQAPAHMCYVLKHEKYAHLRCDSSNYQICMDEPEAVKLIFDMYDDVCNATRGVEYFHVSDDEVYYAGICQRFRRPYNPVNRSLTLVDFLNKAHEFLARRGRRIVFWGEYPILTEHVSLLPADAIDGIIGGNDEFIRAENARGIRQLAYCPIQGEEKLFPHYFPFRTGDGRSDPGRLAAAYEATTAGKAAKGDPIGSFVAAWDDAGLHNETFWLGWAAMAQGGWTPGGAGVDQTVADFMDLYYGHEAADMVEVYRDMQSQARFWEQAWDHRLSKVRGPAYGYSGGKRPVTRSDMTLLAPALPRLPDLAVAPGFRGRYERLLAEVPARLEENERLVGRLQANLTRTRRNRYNLEVFLSLAHLVRHFLRVLAALEQAEDLLLEASAAHRDGHKQRAVGLMLVAHGRVAGMVRDLRATYRRLVTVWEKGQLPRNAAAGGKTFLYVMDDVKDHFADRRADLSYLIAPEENMELPAWCDSLAGVIAGYARENHLTVSVLPEPMLED